VPRELRAGQSNEVPGNHPSDLSVDSAGARGSAGWLRRRRSAATPAVAARRRGRPVAAPGPAAPAQLDGDAWGAVAAVRAGVDAADLADQPCLLPVVVRGSLRGAAGPGVVGRPGHPGRRAGGGYREPCGLLGIDTAVAHHGVDVSLTQKATVRLSRSRSIRSLAFSRSSARSRACSSRVSPSCSPRSMRSRRTQLPRVES
jgi:hypothetical protein